MQQSGSMSRRRLFSMIGVAAGASVMYYVSTHFGNQYADAVTPQMVRAARESH